MRDEKEVEKQRVKLKKAAAKLEAKETKESKENAPPKEIAKAPAKTKKLVAKKPAAKPVTAPMRTQPKCKAKKAPVADAAKPAKKHRRRSSVA